MADLAPQLPSIAIIGMACRYPGASSTDAFWGNLCAGREGIAFLPGAPDQAEDPAWVGAAGMLDDIEWFDAELFGIPPREAALMDPQHRIFLECAWEALEDAGCDPARFAGTIGVFAGANRNTYLLHNLLADPEALALLDGFQVSIASDNDYLATRVCHKLDLRGPGVTVQCASSTSLVAVHLACRAIQTGDCDMALAGGVAVKVPQDAGYRGGGVRSPDGHTRPFDARAQGTVFGSGVGIVVLKSLARASADGDPIRAVILGSAVNNDGARKGGYTAPSVEGIAEVVHRAHAAAGVDPATIGLVEAHATGTAVGDPVEIAALTRAFQRRTARTGYCALGSVKGNIGHSTAAAGAGGLIKAALALEHRVLPPSLNFDHPNPAIDFAGSPFYVNTTLRPWSSPGQMRRAGVSALGFGGTNVHVVLEEAPPRSEVPSRGPALVVLSGRSRSSLEAGAERLSRHLAEDPELDLADVAHTLLTGRRPFPHRLAVVARSLEEAVAGLTTRRSSEVRSGVAESSPPALAFVFPGHGSQHVGMGRGLYRSEPVFRETFDCCTALFRPHLDVELADVLHPPAGTEDRAAALLARTRYIQPALFTVETALARLFLHYGVRPAAVLGYSIGEYVAAHLAGVFTLEDAVTLVAARSALAEGLPEGAMLAVALPAEHLAAHLSDGIELAAVSAPSHSVVAGDPHRIQLFRDRLAALGIASRRLGLTRAFHSAAMDGVLASYRAVLERVRLQPPALGLVSGVTGTWLRADEAVDPEHWVRELRQPVLFAPAVAALAEDQGRGFLEVGPGTLLTALIRGHPAVRPDQLVVAACRSERETLADEEVFLQALATLWVAGCPVEWSPPGGRPARRVSLPGIVFERGRYWVNGAAPAAASQPVAAAGPRPRAAPAPTQPLQPGRIRPGLGVPFTPPEGEVERRLAEIWESLLGVGQVGAHDRLFELGGDSLLAVQIVSRVRDTLGVEVSLSAFLSSPTLRGLADLVSAPEVRSADPAICGAPSPAGTRETDTWPEFSLFFFSGDESVHPEDRYRLVLAAARFADRNGFAAVWTPERHFDRFGGLYPNPAVLGAALAVATERIGIRAGSVVLPLHDPLRVAEEWAVVDNLSHGRVAISFAAGFHPRDFVLAADHFADRRRRLRDGVELFRRLWSGENVTLRGGDGAPHEVRVYPRPVQREPAIWLTATSSGETFLEAGRLGTNVLTALLRFGIEELGEHITRYRETRAQHGHDPAGGRVAVMLHTYVGDDAELVRGTAADPLMRYLRSHLEFFLAGRTGATPQDHELVLRHAFDRYMHTHALIGTPAECRVTVERLRRAGVNEVACLVDFGIDPPAVLQGLERLGAIRSAPVPGPAAALVAAVG